MEMQRGRLSLFLSTLLLAVALGAAPLAAQPGAAWWYPDGTPEGTNRSLAPSSVKRDSQLVVRWRTTALRGAQTVLVGAIRSRNIAEVTQEVVGLMGDTLVILSADGTTLLSTSYRGRGIFPDALPFTLRLTGLFNPTQTSFLPGGKPLYIGIGVEREQSSNRDDSVWAFLADSSGEPAVKIVIGRIPDSVTNPNQRSAGVYPVASYKSDAATKPNIVTIVTQDSWTPGNTLRFNNIFRYTIEAGSGFAQLHDGYPVAPKTYPASPSFFSDGPISTIGLATAPYSTFTDTISPLGNPPTHSNDMYSIEFVDKTDALEHVRTRKMPPEPTQHPGGWTRSYVLTLYEDQTVGGSNYRLIAENHGPDPRDNGTPRLQLVRLRMTPTEEDTTFGEIVDTDAHDHGWKVVAANVDGEITNTGGVQHPDLPNNNADEILAAQALPGDPDITGNQLRLIRLNVVDKVGGKLEMREFARQSFDGRLMCAGDLAADSITDPHKQDEVVIANGSRLSILRLLPYTEFKPLVGQYFKTIRTFDLDSRILDCAIASITGNGGNQLIVTTEKATYAIGLPDPQAFPEVRPDTTTLCIGTPLTLRWKRRIGGGEEGVLLSLLGSSGEVRIGARDTSRVGLDSLTVQTTGIPPGVYRLRIGDSLVPNAADSSVVLTLRAATISAPTASTLSTTLDSTIHLAAQVYCPERPLLLRSIEGGAWETLAPVPLVGDSLIATAAITCTPALACLERDSIVVHFKFVDTATKAESDPIAVSIRLPRVSVALEPGDTSKARTREIRWKKEDFACATLELSLSPDSGRTWRSLGTVPSDRETMSLVVSDDIAADSVQLRLCCLGSGAPGCAVASVAFEIEPAAAANYIAPNPFNPLRGTARIVYRLNRPGKATATILDAGRGVVARLNDETGGGEAGRRSLMWDGRTSGGGIVATGSYICLVESDGGESIVIPFYVMQR